MADITAKAGIGKGTAYEYFRSKDELLIRALRYDYYLNCFRIEKALKSQTTFRGTVDAMFDQIEQCRENKRLAMQCLKLLDELREKDENCVKEQMSKEVKVYMELLDYIIETGRTEGVLSKAFPGKLMRLELGAKFVGYYMFLQANMPDEEERRATRDFLYGALVKSLG